MMNYESLSDGGFATGSMMGSGGFIVLDEDQCVVRAHHDACPGSTGMKAAVSAHPAGRQRMDGKDIEEHRERKGKDQRY